MVVFPSAPAPPLVTIPVAEPIGIIPDWELAHVPPGVALLNVDDIVLEPVPIHISWLPVITDGVTVTTVVAIQPVPSV